MSHIIRIILNSDLLKLFIGLYYSAFVPIHNIHEICAVSPTWAEMRPTRIIELFKQNELI